MENRRATVLHSLFSKTSGHQSAALLLANDLHPLHHTLSAACCADEVDAAGEARHIILGYPRSVVDVAAEHVVHLHVGRNGIAVSEEYTIARWVGP